MRPNEIENDAPVDVARRFAGGYLKICEIDLSHLAAAPSSWLFPEGEFTPRKGGLVRGAN
jgi:hypothetical protein